MKSVDDTEIFEHIKAKIEEHQKREIEAITRARVEREKWLEDRTEKDPGNDLD